MKRALAVAALCAPGNTLGAVEAKDILDALSAMKDDLTSGKK
jgi:hypothetical protein